MQIGSADIRVSHVTSQTLEVATVSIVSIVVGVTGTATGSVAVAALPDAAGGGIGSRVEHELVIVAGTLKAGVARRTVIAVHERGIVRAEFASGKGTSA